MLLSVIFLQIRIMCIVLCTLIVLFLQSTLFPQQFAFKKYTKASGLASNYIFDLYQDKNGFIWAATDRGVSRYDGHNFQTYTISDGLGENLVYDIFQDQEGAMWFGTYAGGVTCFDGNNFKTLTEKDGLLSNNVQSITQDNFGRMYFITTKGLSVLVDSIFLSIESNSDMQGTILRHSSGKIFFSIDSSLFSLDPTNDNRLLYQKVNLNPPSEKYLYGSTWASPFELNNKNILFPGRYGYLKLYLNDENRIIKLEQYKGTLSALLVDRFGQVWKAFYDRVEVQTENGVKIYSKDQGLEPSFVESILEDSEGTIWLGTFGGGIYKIIGDHLTIFTDRDGLNSKVVNSLFEDSRHRIWAGTTEGVSLLLNHGTNIRTLLSVSSVNIQSFAEDKNGNIFIGTFTGILNPLPSNHLELNRLKYKSRIPAGVSSIYIDSNNVLWAGSYGGGVYCFSNSGSKIYTTQHGLASNIIEEIVGGPNSIWFLSRGHGATQFKNNSFKIFSMENGLPSNAIYSLLEEDSIVWFGTDRGLIRMNNGKIKTFNEKHGLLGRYVQKIFRSKENQLYILTDKALHKLDDEQIRVFGSSPILHYPDASINDVYFSQASNELWLATTGGIIKIDLNRVIERQKLQTQVTLKVAITDVFSDTTELFHYSTGFQDNNSHVPELEYSSNNVKIRYAGLSFIDEQSLWYRFKLEGADENWSELVKENEVLYPNLRSGYYTFFVHAIGPDGIQSETPAQFSFRILPPYWATTWFHLLVGTLILMGIVLLIRYLTAKKLKKQLRKMEIQQKLQEERVRISGELHDNIGANLSNIAAGLEITQSFFQKGRKTEAAKNLNFLEKHTRATISQLRGTIWSLTKQAINAAELNIRIEEFLKEHSRYASVPKLSCTLNGDGDTLLLPAQSLNLFRICQEAINNSIKYASAKKILVTIDAKKYKHLKLRITDDGKSFDVAQQESSPSGYGLLNIRQRAKKIGAELKILSEKKEGTSVDIYLILNKK